MKEIKLKKLLLILSSEHQGEEMSRKVSITELE